jgi:hypothetical protein
LTLTVRASPLVALLQVNVNARSPSGSASVVTVPEVGRSPDHAPLATQLVAPLLLHAKAVELPTLTVLGVAVNESMTAVPDTSTVRVTEDSSPLRPRQLSVNSLLRRVSGPLPSAPPELFFVPVQALPGTLLLAEQDTAFVTTQVSVTLPPAATAALFEVVSVMFGGSVTIKVRSMTVLPPDPVHVRVNFLSPGVRL